MTYTDWKNKVDKFRKIDVRGVVGNFFQGLKKQVSKLPQGEGVTIIQSLVPLIIRCIKLSDELGATAELRGLNADKNRTCIYDVRFGLKDVFAVIVYGTVIGLIYFGA